jgi:hypothetical protein
MPAPFPRLPTGGLRPASTRLLACIGAQSITGRTFRHWVAIARRAEAGSSSRPTTKPSAIETRSRRTAPLLEHVMAFLVSSDWVVGEAADLGIQLPEQTVKHEFDVLRAIQFPKRGEFSRFLQETGESIGDLLFRVRLNLLSTRIQQHVVASAQGEAAKQTALEQFVKAFKSKWQSQTYCLPAYAVVDCGHVQASL